ncbi:MAG: nucleotidyltransferase domain-containing protein [Caldilineaceae bacterium]
MAHSVATVYEYPPLQQAWPANGKPLFREVRSPYFLQVTEEILAEIVRRIVTVFAPQKIILFGSYGYGTPSVDSDVDLLVIQKTNLQRVERSVAISELILPRPFPVDILVKTPNEIQEALNKNDPFIKEIISQGRILYEQSH